MRRQRGLIFDLDGTLIDSGLTILSIINAIRVERDHDPICMTGLRPHLSKGGRALVNLSLGACASDPEHDLSVFRGRYATIHQGVDIVFGGVQTTLDLLLADGWRLGLCTNKPELLAENALEHTGLGRYFEVVVAGCESRLHKPHPAPLLETCARMGLAPADCVYVGDSEVDSQTAVAAGMPFVFATYGYPVGAVDSVGCEASIDSFAELPLALETLHRRDMRDRNVDVLPQSTIAA